MGGPVAINMLLGLLDNEHLDNLHLLVRLFDIDCSFSSTIMKHFILKHNWVHELYR